MERRIYEVRCEQCNKKFGEIEDNKLVIICHRCKHLNIYELVKKVFHFAGKEVNNGNS
jgi:phage FluMu protein Com